MTVLPYCLFNAYSRNCFLPPPYCAADVARIAEGKLLLVSGGARSDVYDKGDRLLPVALLQGPAAAAPAGTRV